MEPTCTAILIDPIKEIIYQFNLGDSRSIIVGIDRKIISVTEDHKPNNPIEKERIIACGSGVFDGRINYCLALSRAFGDFEYKCKITIIADGDENKIIRKATYEPYQAEVSVKPWIRIVPLKDVDKLLCVLMVLLNLRRLVMKL